MTKKRGCFISVLLAVLLCFSIWAAFKLYDWYKYSPRLNPHPQYFLTVQGRVDPALNDNIQLEWTMTYITSNQGCEEAPDFGALIEGAMFPREHEISYLIKIEPDGSFNLKAPLDALKPGSCQWYLVGGDYKYAYKNQWIHPDFVTATNFNSLKKAKTQLSQTWLCDSNNCDLTDNSDILGNHTLVFNQPVINLLFLRRT